MDKKDISENFLLDLTNYYHLRKSKAEREYLEIEIKNFLAEKVKINKYLDRLIVKLYVLGYLKKVRKKVKNKVIPEN